MQNILFLKEERVLTGLSRVALFGVILLLSFIYVHAASAATISVTTTDDEIDASYATDCDPGNESDCSLREAIELSNENEEDDTITLGAGTFTLTISGSSENDNQTGDLDIFDSDGGSLGYDLTITGDSQDTTIIDGNDLDRIFHFYTSKTTFTLADLTLTNGSVTDNGGAINYDGSASSSVQVIINDVTFSNHEAVRAGALYLSSSAVQSSLARVTISDNATTGT